MSDRLTELTCRYLDRVITPDEFAELDEMITRDTGAAARFRALCVQSRILCEPLRDRVVELAAHSPTKPDLRDAKVPTTSRRFIVPLAAALLLSAAAVAVYLLIFSFQITASDDDASTRPIITLIDATGDVMIDDNLGNPGDEYPNGRYSIASGSAELQLIGGTTIRLHGDSALQIESPTRSSILRGSATFHCPPAAVGYTVTLPDGARVIDLGTRFTVDAVEGRSIIAVTEGRVQIEHPALPDAAELTPPMVCIINPGSSDRPIVWARRSLITPASLKLIAGETLEGFELGFLIDESGFDSPPQLGRLTLLNPDKLDHPHRWVTARSTAPYYFANAANPRPQIVVTLEHTCELRSLAVWGYGGNANEASDFTVEFSTDGGVTWDGVTETVATDYLLGNEGAELRFKRPHSANAVRVTITDNAYGRGFAAVGGDRVGFGALRFVGDVPLGTPQENLDAPDAVAPEKTTPEIK